MVHSNGENVTIICSRNVDIFVMFIAMAECALCTLFKTYVYYKQIGIEIDKFGHAFLNSANQKEHKKILLQHLITLHKSISESENILQIMNCELIRRNHKHYL